jgi:hypothetical protein
MADDFDFDPNVYIEDVTPVTIIKYSNNPEYSPWNLLRGELSYNYESNTLMIGNLINPGANKPVTIFTGTNDFANLLISAVSVAVTDKAPTSASVAYALNQKADLTHSNKFTGINEFPYLDISTCAPIQENMPVTIKMLLDHLGGENARILSIQLFNNYLEPDQSKILVQHSSGFPNFEVVSITDTSGDKHVAPVEVIDQDSFIINFSTPTAVEVKVMFYE